MKLTSLAKKLDFTTEYQYFDYCMDSHFNGQFQQCKELFTDMTKQDRKGLISYIIGCYDNAPERDVYKFYFNLL